MGARTQNNTQSSLLAAQGAFPLTNHTTCLLKLFYWIHYFYYCYTEAEMRKQLFENLV